MQNTVGFHTNAKWHPEWHKCRGW